MKPQPSVLCGKDRNRWGPAVKQNVPFFSFGNTWRGEHFMQALGWYVYDGSKLHGPFAQKPEKNVDWDAV